MSPVLFPGRRDGTLPVFGAGPASWAVVPSFLTQTPLSAAGLRDQLGEHPQRLDGSSTAGGGRCCSLISFINNLQTRLKPVSSSYTEGILYVSEAFSAEVIPQLLSLDQKIHLGWAEPRIVLYSCGPQISTLPSAAVLGSRGRNTPSMCWSNTKTTLVPT